MLTASMSTGTSSVINAHLRRRGPAELSLLAPVAPAACLAAYLRNPPALVLVAAGQQDVVTGQVPVDQACMGD